MSQSSNPNHPLVLIVHESEPGKNKATLALCRRLEKQIQKVLANTVSVRVLNRKVENTPIPQVDILVVLSFSGHFPGILNEFQNVPKKILAYPLADRLSLPTRGPADAEGVAEVDLRINVGPTVTNIVALIKDSTFPTAV